MTFDQVIVKMFDFGPVAVIALLLIYFGYKLLKTIMAAHRKDYEGVCERLNKVEDRQMDSLKKSLDDSTLAIHTNSRVLEQNADVIRDIQKTIIDCKKGRAA